MGMGSLISFGGVLSVEGIPGKVDGVLAPEAGDRPGAPAQGQWGSTQSLAGNGT